MVKCSYCGKETGKKVWTNCKHVYCNRECMTLWRRKNGTWNKGMKWAEMYDDKSLKKLRAMNESGEKHHNYGRKREDVTIRNLLNNPSYTKETLKRIHDAYAEDPINTLKRLKEKSLPKKETWYQRKAFKKYGHKCAWCGETKGQIDVHHIDCNHRNQNIDNLIVLCAPCHGRYHNPKKP